MPRFWQRSLVTILDVISLSIAFWLAFLFRFEFEIPSSQLQVILLSWPFVVAINELGLYVLGVPRMSWRYMTMRDTVRVGFAIAVSTTVLLGIRIVAPMLTDHRLVFLPLGVIAMD